MIEIVSTSPKKEEKTKVKSQKRTPSIQGKEETFTKTVQKTIQFEFQGTIDELMKDLKDQEKRFLDRQTENELNRYKSIIQKILKTVLDKGFKTQILKRRQRDKSDFIIIEDVNKRLLKISHYITNKENKSFKLLKAIEEIRGLILDLFL